MAKKDFLCNIIFKVLSRGLVVLDKKDSIINQELSNIPNNFTISFGILPVGDYTFLVKKDDKFYVSKKEEKADLRVLFKNAKSAKKVMLAQSSIAESYCRHDLIVGGDIALGMTLVRAINRTEKYLFPHFMTKRYLNKIKKQTCSLNVYGKIFFTKLSQPSNK